MGEISKQFDEIVTISRISGPSFFESFTKGNWKRPSIHSYLKNV